MQRPQSSCPLGANGLVSGHTFPGGGRSGELGGPAGLGQAARQLFPSWDSWRWYRVGQFGWSPSFHGGGWGRGR